MFERESTEIIIRFKIRTNERTPNLKKISTVKQKNVFKQIELKVGSDDFSAECLVTKF